MQKSCLHILDNPFGPDPRVLKEIKTLQTKLGIKVILACTYKEKPEKAYEYDIDIRRIIPNNVKTYYKSDTTKIENKLLAIIKSENIKIIHAHDHISLNIAAKLKKKNKNLKLIYDAHEYIRGWYTYQQESKISLKAKGLIVQRLFSYNEKKNLKAADVLITVSNGLSDLFRNMFSNKPIYVLRNVSYAAKTKVNTGIREAFSFDKNDYIILHSGGIYYDEKSLMYLFRNIEISDSRFKFVFLCNSKGRSKIENAAYYNKIKDKVFFHDFVPYESLSSFISTADIGLMLNYKPHWPSHWHSLPNRIFDYSNAGLAIVSTKQPEFIKFIQENNNGLFFDFDKPNDLNNVLNEALLNISCFKENSLKNASNNVWEHEAEILTEIYNNL